MSDTITNLPASVRSRLRNISKESGHPFQEILQYYVLERFLYRLSKSRYCHQFILKGGLIFFGWGVALRRPTRDIDFRGYITNDIEDLEQIVREICDEEVEADGLVFDPESVRGEETQVAAGYQGIRIQFWGYLGNAKVHMQIDIGFKDEITPDPISIKYPQLLDFPAPELKGYPPETVIAEKLEAMVALGEINSRMKDFYDIWLLAQEKAFDGAVLKKAIEMTFHTRDTPFPEGIPPAFTQEFARDKQSQWGAFYGKIEQALEQGTDFESVIQELSNFLWPTIEAIVMDKEFSKRWIPGKGWR